MNFYRLIKPEWAKPVLTNGEKNPKFVEAVEGDDVIDGCDFPKEFLEEKNKAGYNIYFFPNHPSKDVYSEGTKYLSGKLIDTFEYIFVDMDLKDKVYKTKEAFLARIAEFALRPTFVVDSGNGIHAYWKMSDLQRDTYVYLQLALIHHFNTDESVFTVLQLMRLPGYMNTKRHNDYVLAEILNEYSSGAEYSTSELPPDICDLPKEVLIRGENHLAKLDGKIKISLPDNVNLDELPDSFLSFIDDPANIAIYQLFHDPKGAYGGDRSGADLRLANMLYKYNFNRKEALSIISNTQKALEKGSYRNTYAQATVDKVYIQKLTAKFKTVADILNDGDYERDLGEPVKATDFLDGQALGNPWRKKEVVGLIAGPGVGKTTMTLKLVKDMILNNPDKDDFYIFFSLEMPVAEIVDRWVKLVGKDSPLASRLYVIGNEDEAGEPRNLGLQEIHEISTQIKKDTGKALGCIAIDHIGILSKHINTKKKYTFGIQSETDSGWGDVRQLSLNSLATQLKPLAKMLDTLVVCLTQTTKGKGTGDVPIDKDGAYGISQYENIMDRILTIWQPLMRVQNLCKTKFMAYQYVKIRSKHKLDRIQTYDQKLLTFDLDSGELFPTSNEEYQEFLKYEPMAREIRENLDKKKNVASYSIHVNLDTIDKAKASLGLVK